MLNFNFLFTFSCYYFCWALGLRPKILRPNSKPTFTGPNCTTEAHAQLSSPARLFSRKAALTGFSTGLFSSPAWLMHASFCPAFDRVKGSPIPPSNEELSDSSDKADDFV